MSSRTWLDVIGIGEDGVTGFRLKRLKHLEAAEVIIGGDRHHKLTPDLAAERVAWPSPFRNSVQKILEYKGRQVAILVTGDPLWYSVGALIATAYSS